MKPEIMVRCFFSLMMILGFIGLSYKFFQIATIFGEVGFLDAVLSTAFIYVGLLIARVVWLE